MPPGQMERHLRLHDASEIAALAHTVKGSAGYFCAQDFCAAAERLERAARDGDAEGIEIHSRGFCARLRRLLGDMSAGLAALRERGEPVGSGIDLAAVHAMVVRAAQLVDRGDYAASSLLEQICTALGGHECQQLAKNAQTYFDELELKAAGAAILQLRTELETVSGNIHS